MDKKLSCFVIIGYGKKTSYANGKPRVLDLDETYSLLIKPVFDALNIDCYRAIDKNLNGSIDQVMLEEILHADIALTDISTLNANVMWELGVRHALKPHHTIMICESEQMASIPFDINHFVVYQYTHSEQGIPYKEVERFRSVLTKLIQGLIDQSPQTDSPVFTFLKDEMAKDNRSREDDGSESFADLLKKAEEAKNSKDFETAISLFAKAKQFATDNMTLKDNLSFIISRIALCTYKSKLPGELESLEKAELILSELKPEQSQDMEILGLSGAIHKRMYELSKDVAQLELAIKFYEKGFTLKQDYYNGINAAFMLYKKAALLKSQNSEDWEDVKLKADYIRNTVLEVSLKLESDPHFNEMPDAVWVLFTIAETYHYKKNEAKMTEYETKAKEIAEHNNMDFALSSYLEQKENIKILFQNF